MSVSFKKYLSLVLGLMGFLLVLGCVNRLDGDRLYHAYWSAKGPITVNFEKQPNGSYFFFAVADIDRTDKDVLDAWHRFVDEVARGRKVRGQPELVEFDYKQGYSIFNPYAMGQPRRAKQASGYVFFEGQIVRN